MGTSHSAYTNGELSTNVNLPIDWEFNPMLYGKGCATGGREPQPGPPSHLVWPLPTLWFFPIMQENPNVHEETKV